MWFGPTLQKPRGISGEMEMEVKAGIAREREQMGQPSGRRRKGREMRGEEEGALERGREREIHGKYI